jgi:hypothetical protein
VTLKVEDKVIHPGIPEFAYDIGLPLGAAARKGICNRKAPAPIPFGKFIFRQIPAENLGMGKAYSLAMASAVT